MKEWLPDTFEPRQMDERIVRAVAAVRRRNENRNRTLRAAKWAAGAIAVLAAAFFFAPKVNHREVAPQQVAGKTSGGAEGQRSRTVTEPESRGVGEPGKNETPPAGAESASPHHPIPSSPLPESPNVSLAKAKNGVELKWQGNPNEDYVVYRCTSPRFENCDVAGVVKGTKWTDREADRAPLVFYKIEPKDKG